MCVYIFFTTCVVLAVIALEINIGISAYFAYKYMNCNKENVSKYDINIATFNSNLLKIDKKSYKVIDIYYIGYITIKKIGDCESIYSVNSL